MKGVDQKEKTILQLVSRDKKQHITNKLYFSNIFLGRNAFMVAIGVFPAAILAYINSLELDVELINQPAWGTPIS